MESKGFSIKDLQTKQRLVGKSLGRFGRYPTSCGKEGKRELFSTLSLSPLFKIVKTS